MNNSTNDVNQVAKRPIILAGGALLAIAIIIAIVLGVRVGNHSAALEASAKSLSEAETKVSALTDEIATHVEANAALTEENATLSEAKSTLEAANTALEAAKADLEDTVAAHAKAIDDAEARLQSVTADHMAQVSDLGNQVATLQSSLESAETDHAATKSALDEATKSLEAVTDNHNMLSERIKNLDSEVFRLQNDAANKQARIAELEGIQNTRKTRDDNGLHASIAVKDSQISALQSAVDAHKEKADAHAAENEELRAHIKNLEDALGMGTGHGPVIPEAEKLPDGAQENTELPE